jgi:hypothetical protein
MLPSHRTVLETTRTLFVWLVDLLLFYTPLGMGKLGESWSPYSFIQLAGFVVLVAGTVIYGKGDETEIEAEMAEYEGAGGEGAEGWTRQATGPVAITPRPAAGVTTTPIGIASGSLRASRAMNAAASYRQSYGSSVSRSVGARYRLLSPPGAGEGRG